MIATPPFLIGACLLFWGWQTGNWIAAGVLALLVETLRRLPLRFTSAPPSIHGSPTCAR